VETQITYIALLTTLGSGIGAMTGFGIATIMTPLLLFFLPLPETLLLVGIIHMFGSLWQILLFREGVRWRLLLAFGAPGIITSFIGASISLNAPREILSRVLGGYLVIYVLFILVNPRFRLHEGTLTSSVGGASYGFLAGIFGIGGAVRAMFLSAFDLPKAVYIATSGAIALVIDSTRIATYFAGGTRLEPLIFFGLVAFIPSSLLGSVAGKKIVEKIPQDKFRFFIAAFIFLAGLDLAIFP
jgi:uncharacterized membrane protein YfcA